MGVSAGSRDVESACRYRSNLPDTEGVAEVRHATGNLSLDSLDSSPQEASSDDDGAPCSESQHFASSVSLGMLGGIQTKSQDRPVEPGATTTAMEKKRPFVAPVVGTVLCCCAVATGTPGSGFGGLGGIALVFGRSERFTSESVSARHSAEQQVRLFWALVDS